MRVIFFGCTKFSEKLLNHLLDNNVNLVGIFSIPEYFNISYDKNKVKNSNYSDLSIIANKQKIPYYEIDSVLGKKTLDFKVTIERLKPDVILVLGWYYMVPKSIREIPKYGSWGIHASLLPNYAGGAPLVWAIINGEKETGVTLFRMDSGVDDGDIILQKSFSIEHNDTIKEVYENATLASKNILDEIFLKKTPIMFKKQDKNKIKVYPQRKPSDGEIDWNCSSDEIRNFIRAQTKPYPGAFTIINDKKIIIWEAKIENL